MRAWAAFLVFAVGCGGTSKPKPAQPSARPVARKPKPRPVPRPVEPPPPPAPTAEGVQIEVLAALDAWVAAQQDGKADAYLDLYDEMNFKALVHGKKEPAELDFAAWRDRRAAELTEPSVVVAERPLLETWLDAGSGLEHGVSQVTFFERFMTKAGGEKAGRRGVKILRWRRDDGGKHHVVGEEVLTSEKGFRGKKEKPAPWTVDAAVLPTPVQVQLAALTISEKDAENPKDRVFLRLQSGELLRVVSLETDAGGCHPTVDAPAGPDQMGALSCFWAGAGVDFKVTHKKDTLVIERQLSDDGAPGGSSGWLLYATVTLAKGAAVERAAAAADSATK